MKKYLNLIFGIIGLIIIYNTFRSDLVTKEFFGYQLNIWIYRGIWAFILISSFADFYFKSKKKNN